MEWQDEVEDDELQDATRESVSETVVWMTDRTTGALMEQSERASVQWPGRLGRLAEARRPAGGNRTFARRRRNTLSADRRTARSVG